MYTAFFGRKMGQALANGALCLSTPKHHDKSGTANRTPLLRGIKTKGTTNMKICNLTTYILIEVLESERYCISVVRGCASFYDFLLDFELFRQCVILCFSFYLYMVTVFDLTA